MKANNFNEYMRPILIKISISIVRVSVITQEIAYHTRKFQRINTFRKVFGLSLN